MGRGVSSPSHLLEEQHIGLEEVGDGIWDLYYSHVRFGQMDERILEVEDALGRSMRNYRCKGCPRTKASTLCPAVHGGRFSEVEQRMATVSNDRRLTAVRLQEPLDSSRRIG